MASNLVQVNWETQKKVLFSSLGTFRSKEIHTDITLSCEGENFSAHRLVLSMCSGFFKKALHNSSSTSTSLIVMFGLRKAILEALLNFVYDGTTTIRNDDIPDLLNAGKRLEIPGLMDMGNTSNYNSYNSPKHNDGLETGKHANTSEGMDFTRNSLDFTRNSSEGTDFSKKIIKTEVVACSPEKNVKNLEQGNANSYVDHNTVQRENDSSDSDVEDEAGNGSRNSIRSNIGNQNLRKRETGYESTMKNLVSSKRIHECPICSRRFSRLASLQEHIELHDAHASTIFPCNNCGKSFGSERVYVTHVSKCATDSPKIQSVSMTPFKNSRKLQNLNKRSRIDDDDEGLEKIMLGSQQKQKFEELHDHVISDDQGASSHVVNKSTNKAEQLVKDKAINLKKSVATLNNRYCTLCSKIFPTIVKYKDHKKSDCKMLECQYCLREYEFEKKSEYLSHVTIHSGKNPYSCPKCDFVTANEVSLENHVALLHTGIYRFWCPLCDFQAMKFSELKAHSKSEHPDVLTTD